MLRFFAQFRQAMDAADYSKSTSLRVASLNHTITRLLVAAACRGLYAIHRAPFCLSVALQVDVARGVVGEEDVAVLMQAATTIRGAASSATKFKQRHTILAAHKLRQLQRYVDPQLRSVSVHVSLLNDMTASAARSAWSASGWDRWMKHPMPEREPIPMPGRIGSKGAHAAGNDVDGIKHLSLVCVCVATCLAFALCGGMTCTVDSVCARPVRLLCFALIASSRLRLTTCRHIRS